MRGTLGKLCQQTQNAFGENSSPNIMNTISQEHFLRHEQNSLGSLPRSLLMLKKQVSMCKT